MWGVVLSLLSFVLSFFRKSPERKLGETEVRLEDAEKENAVLKEQLAITFTPELDARGVDEWLSGNFRK